MLNYKGGKHKWQKRKSRVKNLRNNIT